MRWEFKLRQPTTTTTEIITGRHRHNECPNARRHCPFSKPLPRHWNQRTFECLHRRKNMPVDRLFAAVLHRSNRFLYHRHCHRFRRLLRVCAAMECDRNMECIPWSLRVPSYEKVAIAHCSLTLRRLHLCRRIASNPRLQRIRMNPST
jgi:hypothetical protein